MGLGTVERPIAHKGQWRVRVWWRDAEGRRRSVYVYGPTERAALAVAQARQAKEVQDAERERAGLLVRRPPCPTLTEYVIEHHQAIWLGAKPSYLRRQLAQLGRWFEPKLGAAKLDAIRRTDVAEVIARMRGVGLSGATCNRLLNSLSKVLGHALEAGLVQTNVCRGSGSMRLVVPEPPQTVEAYTLDQVARIVEAAQTVRGGRRWAPFLAVAAYTGARPSSVQRLQVGDVRLEGDPPSVVFRETKNGRDLEVPLVAPLVALLRPLVAGRAPDAWLFEGRADAGHIGDGYDPVWRRACEAAGVEVLPFYALRRSFISGTIDAGVSLTTVRDLVGHSSLAITNRYAASRSRKHQAQALDAAWRGANAVQHDKSPKQHEP